jgi:hypothetical protein
MITDPGATPSDWREQIVFGAASALVYFLLILTHIGFAFFYALFIVSFARGLILHLQNLPRATNPAPTLTPP